MDNSESKKESKQDIAIKNVIDVYKEIKQQFRESEFKVKNRVIYHYTSPDGLPGIVTKEKMVLWFSQFNCLNDKAEGMHVYDLYTQILLKALQDSLVSLEFFAVASKIKPCEESSPFIFSTKPTIKDGPLGKHTMTWDVVVLPYTTYLCCFSKSSDSLPMWNYYNKNSGCRGYNVGIKVKELQKGFSTQGCYEFSIRKVIYKTREKTMLLEALILAAYQNFKKIDNDALFGIIGSFLDEWRLLFKNDCFEHEQEIRAILKVPHEVPNTALLCNEFGTGFRQNNGYIVPYVIVNQEKPILTSITIGPLLDFESAQDGVNALLRLNKYHNVGIMRSKVPIRY